MTTISKDNKVITLINIFTVEPENQQRLVDLLVEATEKTMKNLSGFVSANIHKSADGVRVANYALQYQQKLGMSGVDSPLILFDTKIVLSFLGGRLADQLPSGQYFVSVITEIELLSYYYQLHLLC